MKTTLVLVLFLAIAVAAAAAPVPLGDIQITKDEQTGTKDCAGGTATISSNSNKLTLKNCAKVVLSGNENKLTLEGTSNLEVSGNENTVQAGAVKSITAMGNDNTITYKPGAGGKKPSISSLGSRNKISAAK
jgi:hypothetical protein